MKKKIITGVKPTGASMHLGNLMGAVLPFKEIAKNHDSALFIADLHALTSVKDGEVMRKQSLELAIEYFSIFGLDTETIIFRQSDINMGTFNYPILMAADILGYSVDAVPVGKDQIQHLEMARDMARAFNKTYQTDIFIEPEALISQQVATLPGIDGRKMSKSYDNFIGIFDDEKTLKKRVMSIVTDSRGVDEKKDPETCNVFALLKVFAKPEKLEEIREKYLSENI